MYPAYSLKKLVLCCLEINTVAYNEGQKVQLQKKLLLEDAISDLPRVLLRYCCISQTLSIFVVLTCLLMSFTLSMCFIGSEQ